MSVLAKRLIAGTLLGIVALSLLAADRHFDAATGFVLLCLVFVLGGWLELTKMSGVSDRCLRWIGGITIAAAIAGEWWLYSGMAPPWFANHALVIHLGLPFIALAAMFLSSFRKTPTRESLGSIAISFFGLAYLLLPTLCFLRLRFLPEGQAWVLFTLVLVKVNDSGAYFVGRGLGQRPLTRISPKKTWEGAAGGIACGLLAAYAFFWWGEPRLFSFFAGTILGVAGGVAGQLGDLAESYWKRAVGAKDSGATIPAMGGALDIMDSVLFGAPLVYLWAVFVGD